MWILLLLFAGVQCDQEILILHTNDMHSRFSEITVDANTAVNNDTALFGGYARLKTALDAAREQAAAEQVASLYLNGGDIFQGTSLYTLLKQRVVYNLTNMLDLDATCNRELLILHTNDIHSRYSDTYAGSNVTASNDTNSFGGFARLKTAVENSRREAASQKIPSIYVNNGDIFQGTIMFTLLKQKVAWDLMNMLKPDVVSLGNHEFDDGVSVLADFIKHANFPFVACNINVTGVPELQLANLTASTVVERNGTKIGVIGYITTDTQESSNVENVKFTDEVSCVKKEAAYLKSQNINIIIAVGHSGFDVDIKIAKEVPDISLVIGGHDNTFLYNPPEKVPSIENATSTYPHIVTQSSGKKVPVVQAFAYTKYLGKLWITFDNNGTYVQIRPNTNPVLIDSNIKKDAAVEARVAEYEAQIRRKTSIPLGKIRVRVESGKGGCRIRECNFGNFVADSFVDYVASKYDSEHGWTDAPIAIIQAGALRTGLSTHSVNKPILFEDLMGTLPYRTTLSKVRLSGSTLLKGLEVSVEKYNSSSSDPTGRFLQYSGIYVTYNISNSPGSRVVKAEARCGNCSDIQYSPIVSDKEYTIIMSLYLLSGNDGYTVFKNEYLHAESISCDDVDFCTDYLTDTDATAIFQRKLGVSYPRNEGRIKIYDRDVDSVSPL